MTFVPIIASEAGISVKPEITNTVTTTITPSAMERIAAISTINNDIIEPTIVIPEKRIECPAVCIVRIRAARTSSPSCSSCLNRITKINEKSIPTPSPIIIAASFTNTDNSRWFAMK
ncbi:hypothetical protein D3C73_898810 [compost metagenome]